MSERSQGSLALLPVQDILILHFLLLLLPLLAVVLIALLWREGQGERGQTERDHADLSHSYTDTQAAGLDGWLLGKPTDLTEWARRGEIWQIPWFSGRRGFLMHKAGFFITLTEGTGVDVRACVLLPGRSLTLDADQWLKAMEHARLVCYLLRRRTKMRAWQRLRAKSQIKD